MKAKTLATILIGLMCAVGYGYLRWSLVLPPVWLIQLENKPVLQEGVVQSIPLKTPQGLQFLWRLEEVSVLVHAQKQPPGLLSHIRQGDRLRGCVRLRKPPAFVNPHQDERSHWVAQRIQALASTCGPLELIHQAPEGSSVRENLHRQFQLLPTTLAHRGILEGLVLGIKQAMDPEEVRAFRQTGTSHLMAISGLHISLIAGFVWGIVTWVLGFFPALIHRYPRQICAAWLGFFAAVGYAALAGFALPTQRALIMMGLAVFSLWQRRISDRFSALLWAMVLIFIWDPLALLSPGFWLSCWAVAWLIYGQQKALFLGLMPLSLWYFKATTLLAPLANLLAIPWTSFVMVPLALGGFACLPFWVHGADTLFKWADYSATLLIRFLDYLRQYSFFEWHLDPSFWACFLALIGVLVVCLPRRLPGRWLGLLLWLPLLFPLEPQLSQQEARVVVLDVGQGLSVFVQTQRHTLLYDLGTAKAMQRAVLPFLEAEKVRRLDGLVVSHADADHAGGLAPLEAVGRMATVHRWSSDPAHVWGMAPCHQGLVWEWDQVLFEFLHPPLGVPFKNNNNASCVLKITAGTHRILLTGDIEKQSEERLIHALGPQLRAEVLVVPHHGSLSSSTVAFLEQVRPQQAIVTTGRYNVYRHPRPEVLARYQALGIPVIDTGQRGAVELFFRRGKSTSYRVLGDQGLLEKIWYDWGDER